MAKKKAKASKNEIKAAAAGMSVKAYNAAKDKSSSKSLSSKDEKKAKQQVEKYYEEKTGFANEDAATQTKRLQEDLTKIYEEAGIAQTRAMQDYSTQIGNIQANKALDIASIADYVSTNKTRTTEDLSTSLAKESRRFSLESDQINQSLADKGMTFSERTPEQIAKGDYAQNTTDINTEANRSFQDIARYEAAKTAETSLKYGQQTEQAGTAKARTLEDIITEQNKAITANSRGGENIASALKQTLSDYNYQQNDATSTIGNYYDSQKNSLASTMERVKVIGT